MIHFVDRWWGSKQAFRALVALNGIVALVISWLMRDYHAGDMDNYLALAEGILHGRYSSNWMESSFVPDTLRTPGFPLYIAAVIFVFGSWKWIIMVQLVLYATALWAALKVTSKLGGDLKAKNTFLALVLVSFNVPFFIAQVTPEIPVIAAIAMLLLADPLWHRRSWHSAIGAGLLYGFVFQCRPVFLLYPLVRIAADLIWARQASGPRWQALMLGTYVLTLLPYGFWNKVHNGTFRITPLEGGAGVFHLGYWSGRIPNYLEQRYWAQFSADEIIAFNTPAERTEAIAEFEREWDEIDSACAPLMSARDSAALIEKGRAGMVWHSFSVPYTQRRQELLMEKTLAHIAEDPGYYAAYKLLSALRLWVIGVQPYKLRGAGLKEIATALLPSLLTLLIFLTAVYSLVKAYAKGILSIRKTYPLLLIPLYTWLIHIPFTIQTKYTVPARITLYILVALAIAGLLARREKRIDVSQTERGAA